jgi:hypothetical protein
MFPAGTYDPETLGLLKRVFDEAWKDILGHNRRATAGHGCNAIRAHEAHYGGSKQRRARPKETETDRNGRNRRLGMEG